MFCNKCGKETAGKEFCTSCGQSIHSQNISADSSLLKILVQFLLSKKETIKSRVKGFILFLCVYFLSLAVLDGIRNSYYSDDNVFTALAPTILIIYIWNKISKRFGL